MQPCVLSFHCTPSVGIHFFELKLNLKHLGGPWVELKNEWFGKGGVRGLGTAWWGRHVGPPCFSLALGNLRVITKPPFH